MRLSLYLYGLLILLDSDYITSRVITDNKISNYMLMKNAIGSTDIKIPLSIDVSWLKYVE